MAFCTECGSKLPEDAVFCPNCGSSTKSAPASVINAPEELNTVPVAPDNIMTADDAAVGEAGLEQGLSQASGVYTEPAPVTASASVYGTYTSPIQTTYAAPEQAPYPPYQGSYTPPQQNSYAAPEQAAYSPYQGQGGYTPPQPNPYPAQNAYGYPPYPGAPAGNPTARKSGNGKVAAIVISAVAVLLVIAALLIFKPFGRSPYVGYWESVLVDVGDGVLSQDYYGTSVVGALGMQLNSDNSAYLASSADSDIIDATWEKTGDGITVTTDDEAFYFAYGDKRLSLSQDGEIYYFEKIKGHDINNPTIPYGSLAGNEVPLPGSSVAGSGTVGNGSFYIAVIGAEDFIDVDGDPAIRIYYDFTNNSVDGYSLSAWECLSYYAMQEGSYLTETYSSDEGVASNASYRVRPGVTMQCCAEFKYDPYGGSVDFSIYGYYEDESGGTVAASYIPGNLPGAPAPYVIVPMTSPQWTLNIPAEASLDGFYVEVLDAELIDDYNGDPAIRVYYNFTNNSSYSTSLCSELYVYAYQDGVSLDFTYAPEDSETDMNYYNDIAPGTTITASCIFILRNETSPVEAEVEAYSDYTAVGQTYNIAG